VTAAGGLWAALVALGHPPSIPPPDAPPVAESFPSLAAAVTTFLGDATGVVAFGELHQTAQTAGLRSTLARFTDEIWPVIAPRTAHLIVETWVSTGSCGQAEKQVTAEVARATERPAETENEIVRLLRRAKELGVAPHVLEVGCAEYRLLAGSGGGLDYDRLLTITGEHLGRAIGQALAHPHPTAAPSAAPSAGPSASDRTLVVVYGGALHNDLHPDPTLARYTFGPAIDALTNGAYREIDLYLPELVRTLPALRGEPWYRVWRRARPGAGAVMLRRSARSAVILPASPG
jgi:hypothetical protein